MKVWEFLLPGKKFLILILLLSSVSAAHYAINFSYPPEGKIFLGYQDDVLMLTIMKSVTTNFNDPWSFDGGKVWHNPLIGAFFLFIPLGILAVISSMDFYILFILAKVVFGLLYYIVVYNLISIFVEDGKRRDTIFLIFCVAAGIGGILYIGALAIFGNSSFLSVIGYALTREFDELAATAHSLTHIFRLYYVVPETLGYLSLFFAAKNRKVLAGVSLGLAFLFYPMHGIAFSIVLLIYTLAVHRKKITRAGSIVRMFRDDLAATYIISACFFSIWFIPYLQRPYYFSVSNLVYENLPTVQILIGFFFLIIFMLYLMSKNYSGLLKNRVFVSVFSFVFIVFSIENMFTLTLTSPTFFAWTNSIGLYGLVNFLHNFWFVIEACALVGAAVIILSLLKSKNATIFAFMFSWVILFIVLSGVSPEFFRNAVNPVRFAPSLIFPLSILGGLGIHEFSKNFKIKTYFVVAVIVLLSLPSLAGFNLWLQKSARESGVDGYFSESEVTALDFLRTQDRGLVMAPIRFGSFVPYYTGKNAFIFSGRNYTGLLLEINNDEIKFYSNESTKGIRSSIIEKYNITYVIVEGSLQLPDYTQEIYNNGTVSIFKSLRQE